ncbi:phosphotransferase family protein [Geminicoccus flavidas]|uniref:phosphotransferase family protein n=1 Tax=Geminicoccus flavidas TaxID=2506407 RepID=UPI001357AF91|nr:aminoglycoside phosphotransferase family protein [Geminicoccus flavidas]
MAAPSKPPAADGTILAVLRRAGLLEFGPDPSMAPLTGGVSSDIWRVELPDGPVAVKRALQKLKVAQDWQAPVERNAYEAAWMEEARRFAPRAVPRLLHQDAILGALVMAYLEPRDHPLWKRLLMDGQILAYHAGAVGATLAAIHAGTARRPDVAQRFATDKIFHEIRLAPYLLATAEVHPDLGRQLRNLVRTTAANRIALVHGDVSPKNILIGPRGPVFLDAECAWYGDPAFDLAFCLNHLLLKCLWRRRDTAAYLAAFDALAEAYLAAVVWERRDRLEERTAALLPGLLLARVDGKSPVEYLRGQDDREKVRKVGRHFLQHVPDRLATIRAAWAEETAV